MADENNSIWNMSLQEAVQDPRVQNAASAVGNVLTSSPQELLAQLQPQPAVSPNSPMVTPPPNPAEMDAETQDVLLGAANPPKFQAPQNGMSNVPPQVPAEEQNIYPSDLEPAKPVSVVPAADPFAGLNMQMGAQKDLNAATQTLEKTRQANLAKTEEVQAQRIAQYADVSKKYNLELNSRMKSVDDQLKQVEADVLNARKSTADLFHEKSTGQKVAAGIAMILGVAHAGLGGGNGGNMGVQLVEQSLQRDRDLNLQKYAQSKEMLNLKRQNADDYAEMMSRQEAVADKAQLLQLQAIETKLKQAESIYRGSAAAANARNALGQLQIVKDSMRQRIAQQDALNNIMAGAGGDIDQLPPQAVSAISGKNIVDVIQERERRMVRIPGQEKPYFVAKDTDAKEAKDIVSANSEIQDAISDIQKAIAADPILVKGGSWTKAGQEAQSAFGRITAAMKKAEALGALDNGVVKLVSGIIKDPTSIINQNDYNKIKKQFQQSADLKLQPLLKRYNPNVGKDFKFNAAKPGTVDAFFKRYSAK